MNYLCIRELPYTKKAQAGALGMIKMQLTDGQKQQIRDSFAAMNGKEQFLDLLNYVKTLIHGEKAFHFELKQLTYYSNPTINTNRYKRLTEPKKSGGLRIIHAPVKGLKRIQRCLNIILQVVYEPDLHKAAFGFVPGKSVVDNANVHAGANYVYNIDLKDFFHSISQSRIWGRLKVPPFNLKTNKGRMEINNIISSLCCHEITVMDIGEHDVSLDKVNVLPQGASTSPVLTNIICQQLDFYLTAVAKRFGLKYSRYADDITFSSSHYVYAKGGPFLTEVSRIISAQGFVINEKKVRLQKTGYRQEVTGLVVNEKANVTSRYIKQLRMWLYYWERYGFERTADLFVQKYQEEKVSPRGENLRFIIKGKLDYLKMVRGEDPRYQKLNQRFKQLINFDPTLLLSREESGPRSVKHLEEIDEFLVTPQSNVILPHDPFYTVRFLKKFKIADGSGFKELVHDVNLNAESIEFILKTIKQHPNFIYHYSKKRLTGIRYLNAGIRQELIRLVDAFETEGVQYFRKNGEHPFGNDPFYTRLATSFKRMYRYGSGKEYSQLQADILRMASEKSMPATRLEFLPDQRIFNIRASFFTWQPSVLRGLKYIIEGIADHANLNGDRNFNPSEKKIRVEARKIKTSDFQYVEISILDAESLCMRDSVQLMEFIRGSNAFKWDFRNLCDWAIECDFLEEGPKRLAILSSPKSYTEPVEELSFPVGGFKHILKFYDTP